MAVPVFVVLEKNDRLTLKQATLILRAAGGESLTSSEKLQLQSATVKLRSAIDRASRPAPAAT